MYSASNMEEENPGSWLGIGIGGGGGGGCAHGERRTSVQLDVMFPQHVKENRGCDHEQAVNKGGKGSRQRVKVGDGGRRSHGASPSDGGNDGGTRKKLRLTKEQSTLLEDSFRVHNILSHAQKQELARQLNLSARQVEVWFQNRRARSKLKQTEMDLEFLKRYCESLTDENQRLKHELMELQRSAPAPTAGSQLDVQFPRSAAMVNFCPSREKVTVMSVGETSSKRSSSCS